MGNIGLADKIKMKAPSGGNFTIYLGNIAVLLGNQMKLIRFRRNFYDQKDHYTKKISSRLYNT